MSKRRKSSKPDTFSVESLRDEAEKEVNQEVTAAKILNDLGSIKLDAVENVPVVVILCALIVKFGVSVVCALACVVPSLHILPTSFHHEVLKLLCPSLPEDEANRIYQCLLNMPNHFGSNTSQVHVFAPPCSRCLECDSNLVRHNDPVEIKYNTLNGTNEGIKVSLKCNKCSKLYGYAKFGNPTDGWKLYPESRSAVEASDVCFVDRSLLKWQISLA